MTEVTPLYIIPLLIEQPTWGGQYIANFKHISNPEIATKKIGQAYELYSDSLVFAMDENAQMSAMPFAFATATNVNAPTFFHQPKQMQTLQSIIDQNPVGVLGQRAIDKYGPSMQVLIKFTQAQNNSYQVHFRPGKEFGKWLAKPESWYFFEKGKATLGIKSATIEEYKARCIEIDNKAQEISRKIMSGAQKIEDGRAELNHFIQLKHPQIFVNTIFPDRNQVIDLSGGGIHHSWEMDLSLPNGNIVYEVQRNVMDEFCTLRSFDQGNIKDDGKVRPLTIDEYFQALDIDPQHNQPEQYLVTPTTKIFDNEFYKTTSIHFSGEYSGEETQLNDSFHHLFVQEGSVHVVVGDKQWKLEKGWSLFVPAATQSYQLKSDINSTILKTSI